VKQTMLAVFADKDEADSAITELEDDGYDPKDISVVMKEENIREIGSKGGSAFSGTVTGLTTGGVLGGLAGLLVGVGAIAIPGIGAVLIGGPLAAALGLTGAAATTVAGAATGVLAGGIVGVLVDIGVPEHTARDYESTIKREGAILLAVPINSKDDASEVKTIFSKYNADKIRTVSN